MKEAFKDFHVLCYLATTSNLTVQLNDEELIEFIEALKTDNLGKLESFFTGEYWSTLRIILDNSEELGVAGAEKSGEETWACPHCTFINKKEKATCEICSLPPGN